MRRLTVDKISKESGLAPGVIRRLADEGRISHQRDYNGWRIFNKQSIIDAKKLAGTSDDTSIVN